MKEKEFLPYVRERLGIEKLHPMQEKMMGSASEGGDIMLLAPTGSGKTLAFMLPVMKLMKAPTGRVQCVIIAPSRELVLQIAGVAREIARDFRVLALYGGHSAEDEKNSLAVVPDIIVATPGRLLDHIRRRNVEVLPCRLLVLDEFDKSLELGFENDMKKILDRLKNVSRTILTSATKAVDLPAFLEMKSMKTLDFTSESDDVRSRIRVHRVDASGKDKLESLLVLLRNLSEKAPIERTIIFVNHRESAERVYEYLSRKGVACVLYHGNLDQRDRETAVMLFNNGSRPVMVATDLASRGLDIEDVKSVIHYHQALTSETYTHRNGRTARVAAEGDIYLLIGPEEDVKEYVDFDDTRHLDTSVEGNTGSPWATLYISGGKREKLSRGDILGFLVKEGGADASAVGKIDVFDHYSLVAVKEESVGKVLKKIEGKKLKGEKWKITLK